MEQFKEEYKKEKGFECWTEGSNYGSYTDDYVNWLEQKLAIDYTRCSLELKDDTQLLYRAWKKENGYTQSSHGFYKKDNALISARDVILLYSAYRASF